MAKVQPLRPAFNSGEFAPVLHARTDIKKYNKGCAVLENMIPLAEGGLTRRSGTRYVVETKDSTKQARLKPFKFSTTQAYMMEVGDEYIRFNRNQGVITAGTTDASVSNGTFTLDISSSDGSWNDDSTNGTLAHSSSDGRMLMTILSSSDSAATSQFIEVSSSVAANEHICQFQVAGLPGREMTFSVGTSSSGDDASITSEVIKRTGYHAVPFTPNSTQISLQFKLSGAQMTVVSSSYGTDQNQFELRLDDVSIISSTTMEIQTPYDESDVFDVDGPQSADVQYFFHNDYKPHKLLRLGHTNWSLEQMAFTDGPFMSTNDTTTTLATRGTNGRNILVTASTTVGINDDTGFGSSDVGRHLRISNPGSTGVIDWGWGTISGSTSTTTCRVDVFRGFPSTAATEEWKLGAWSDERGWPGVGAFHQQRLLTARTDKQPLTSWWSQVADFQNNAPDSIATSSSQVEVWDGTVEDDDALDFTMSSDDVEAIEWMSPGVTLQMGTKAAEWEVTSDKASVSPTDVLFKRHTKSGSARIQPIRAGHATLFAQREKRTLRELAFNFEVDGLVANNMMRLAKHVSVGGLKQLAYQQEPHSLVWAARNDGQLLSMTYRREEDVVAWGRHILGGFYSSSTSPGHAVVESVATIPGSTASGQTQDSDDRDEVWVAVKRTIEGSTRRYIEFFEREFEDGDDQEDAYYSDSLLTFDGAASSALTGFTHIPGQTAKVYADGAVLADVTVSSSAGTFTIPVASDVVQTGLGYTHRYKSLKFDDGAQAGTAQGQTKKISEVTFIMHNAQTLTFGPSSSQMQSIDFREVADVSSVASPLFTGERREAFGGDWTTDPRVVIESSDPSPFTLTGYVPTIKTNEGP